MSSNSPWSTRALGSADIKTMFEEIAPRYDVLNDTLSFGLHNLWKRTLVKEIPRGSIHLDLCCGTGDIAGRATRLRDTRSTGIDFSGKMIEHARSKYPGISFLEGDATRIPFDAESFEVATISFGVRNIPEIRRCLTEVARVLKPGGILLILEFATPHGLMRPLYGAYAACILPLVGRLVSGHAFAYDYLRETQSKFPFGDAFVKIMESAPFHATARSLNGGLVYLYRAEKR